MASTIVEGFVDKLFRKAESGRYVKRRNLLKRLAPQAGFEPATLRLNRLMLVLFPGGSSSGGLTRVAWCYPVFGSTLFKDCSPRSTRDSQSFCPLAAWPASRKVFGSLP
jgi:hypothetical protein